MLTNADTWSTNMTTTRFPLAGRIAALAVGVVIAAALYAPILAMAAKIAV